MPLHMYNVCYVTKNSLSAKYLMVGQWLGSTKIHMCVMWLQYIAGHLSSYKC